MAWSSLADFLEMGGYGLYVWGSYGMTAVALAWEVVMLVQVRRRTLQDLREEHGVALAGGPAADWEG